MMGCPDTPPDFSRLRENDFSQFALYAMPELTEMCLEKLWELCARKSSLSCFSQFFSSEPTRLTENNARDQIVLLLSLGIKSLRCSCNLVSVSPISISELK